MDDKEWLQSKQTKELISAVNDAKDECASKLCNFDSTSLEYVLLLKGYHQALSVVSNAVCEVKFRVDSESEDLVNV